MARLPLDTVNALRNNLGQAMMSAASSAANNIHFDRTVNCTIVDTSNKIKGEYRVKSTNASFTAYAKDGTVYSLHDTVWVSVPDNNYNNKKWIIGKANEEETTLQIASMNLPLDGFVAEPDNLIEVDLVDKNRFVVNSAGEVLLLEYTLDNDQKWRGLKSLGISCNFQSLLDNYGLISGEYGLKIIITGSIIDTNSVEDNDRTDVFYLSSKNMYGNPYAFYSDQKQELLIDISKYISIKKIVIYFYEDGQFIDKDGNLITVPTFTVDDNIPENFIENFYHLSISELYLQVGLAAREQIEENVILFTRSSSYYNPQEKTTVELQTQIVHFDDKRNKYIFINQNDLDNYNAQTEDSHKYILSIEKYINGQWQEINIDSPFNFVQEIEGEKRVRFRAKAIFNSTVKYSNEVVFNESIVLTDVDAAKFYTDDFILKFFMLNPQTKQVEDYGYGQFYVYDEAGHCRTNYAGTLFSDITYFVQLWKRDNGVYVPYLDADQNISWRVSDQLYSMIIDFGLLSSSELSQYFAFQEATPQSIYNITRSFKIRDTYSSLYSENIIYAANISQTIEFGAFGYQGTEYTLITTFNGEKLICSIRDINNEIIPIDYNNDITINTLYGSIDTPTVNTDGINLIALNNSPAVIQITVSIPDTNKKLTKRISIPYILNNQKYNNISYGDRIEFKSNGVPVYDNVIKSNGANVEISENNGIDFLSIDNDNKLIFNKDQFNGWNDIYLTKYPIVTIDGVCKYAIILDKNVYFSSLINTWDGDTLTLLNTDNNSVLSNRIAAGSKDSKGQFTGVVLGDWNEYTNDTINKNGIYGFQKGEVVFSFLSDGTGTIGTNGNGQIIFDGNKAKISNYNGESYINLNASGNEHFIHFKSGDNYFYVNDSGININSTIFANDGQIGGWKIENNQLTTEKDNNIIKLGFNNDDIVFSSQNFSINKTGEIESKSGTIGGWSIGQDTLKSSDSSIILQSFLNNSNGASIQLGKINEEGIMEGKVSIGGHPIIGAANIEKTLNLDSVSTLVDIKEQSIPANPELPTGKTSIYDTANIIRFFLKDVSVFLVNKKTSNPDNLTIGSSNYSISSLDSNSVHKIQNKSSGTQYAYLRFTVASKVKDSITHTKTIFISSLNSKKWLHIKLHSIRNAATESAEELHYVPDSIFGTNENYIELGKSSNQNAYLYVQYKSNLKEFPESEIEFVALQPFITLYANAFTSPTYNDISNTSYEILPEQTSVTLENINNLAILKDIEYSGKQGNIGINIYTSIQQTAVDESEQSDITSYVFLNPQQIEAIDNNNADETKVISISSLGSFDQPWDNLFIKNNVYINREAAATQKWVLDLLTYLKII